MSTTTFVWVHKSCAESNYRVGFMFLPNADADAILGANAQHPRIGANYLKQIDTSPSIAPMATKTKKSKKKAKAEPKPEAEIVNEVLDGICGED